MRRKTRDIRFPPPRIAASMAAMTHRFRLRVYYEDTDMGGIVYHANFLKFIERGRSEWVREMGLDQEAMRRQGVLFAVRRIEADYLRPARYGDDLEVRTTTREAGGARLVLDQEVRRGGDVLFTARVTVACITASGRAARLPAALRDKPAR